MPGGMCCWILGSLLLATAALVVFFSPNINKIKQEKAAAAATTSYPSTLIYIQSN